MLTLITINLLLHVPNDADAQHAGIEKCKWLRAGTPALIPLFEAVPRLHTVIEISDKNLVPLGVRAHSHCRRVILWSVCAVSCLLLVAF